MNAAGFSFPVSPALKARLAKLGIASEADLLLHLPLRYEDETRLCPIADLQVGAHVQIQACVRDIEVSARPRRSLKLVVEDASGSLLVRFLHFYPSQIKEFQPDRLFRFSGEVRGGFFGLEMVHPRYRRVEDAQAPLPVSLTPVYPTTAGLSQNALRKLIVQALAAAKLEDTLPADLLAQCDLPEFSPSLRLLHGPPPDVPAAALEARNHPAFRRLAFDELLAQQLSLRQARGRHRRGDAPILASGGALEGALRALLPFKPTAAQEKAWREIAADLERPHPMRRLLQGDVGSGKTVVAALACLAAVESGHQAALMAPTEILAEQHYRKLAEWLAPLGLKVGWLASAMPAAEKRRVREALAQGEIALAVGTHALFQKEVAFARLGLAVVDEQHRFGVAQRLSLAQKGGDPHLLMMSATPIPRTLAMSYYADLDLSVIDALPPGRTPVATRLVADARRSEVLARVREVCRAGGQAYWVCPLVEESEKLELQAALDTYETLRGQLPELSLGLVHGRMKTQEKNAVMAAFQAGELQLLVATTVIEVGVDVPNATLMVIEHAERMGLAQLHQLRGRVGRGGKRSVCVLLYQSPLSELARARLKIIYESTDGFEIARQDLLLRGPGEFLGARQSGAPLLRFADPERDGDLLEAAHLAADALLERAPDRAAAHLARWLGTRQIWLEG